MPDEATRDQLGDAFRTAYDAYHAHLRRGHMLADEIRAVAGELASNPADQKLQARAAALAMERAIRPSVAESHAVAYANAAVAWGSHVYPQFIQAADAATGRIDAVNRELMPLDTRIDKLQRGHPDREGLVRGRTALADKVRPHFDQRRICSYGASAVSTALAFLFGDTVRQARVTEAEIVRFVDRSRRAA